MKEEIIKEIGSLGVYCYNNNEYHNINDEPALVLNSGSKIWYKNGLRHRTKGPAHINSINGTVHWWYKGNLITKKVNQLMKEGRLNPDWRNWTEEDEFLFVLLMS